MDLKLGEVINEGKTKVIRRNPKDEKTVYMCFKNDITAGDGLRHDVLEGKAMLDWRTNLNIFRYLNRMGVPTHYIDSPTEGISLVRKLDRKINLEVVSRRVATGSILKWSNKTEGQRFEPVTVEFYYKDDSLHDPKIDDEFIQHLSRNKGASEWEQMQRINREVFRHLEKAFALFKIQLMDFKLEYGIIDGEARVIDEITGGSMRLWPYKSDTPNLNQQHVLSELDPKGRLDKDIYRMQGDLKEVKNKFRIIADITDKFADIK